MPKRRRNFINSGLYHIVLRRMGNELFFGNIDDYYRGIFCIYEFNTTKHITIRERRAVRARFKKAIKEIEKTYRGQTPVNINGAQAKKSVIWEDNRDLLVEVLAFCLMPNHIHLLVRQLKNGGISKFIQKLASGYASYFKYKYGIKLKGHFFQDRFNSVYIKDDEQLRVAFTYIHTNPISLVEPKWKEKGVRDPGKVIKFLKGYKWSSYPDYIGKKNFPSVTERKFLLGVMNGERGCREWVENWVRYKGKVREMMKKFKCLSLEK